MENRYLKLVEILEKDGVTLKGNTGNMNYSEIDGKIHLEVYPTVESKRMVLEIVNTGEYLRTSTVEKVEEEKKLLTVTTRNTIYKFEIINTYEDKARF